MSHNKRSFLQLLLFFTLLIVPLNCLADGKVKVVTTTGMIGDLVKQVGGDLVDVTSLMGPGVDPHLYKATYGDLQKLQSADIIFYNGLHLEGKMSEVLEKLSSKKPCFAVTAEIDRDILRRPPEYEGQFDPHVWFNVKLWVEAIDKVEKEMIAKLSNHKSEIEENAKRYRVQLNELHEWIQHEISKIPKQQRVLITAHDAFGYFGGAYDIEVLGLQGLSTATEFGLHDITKLADLIITRKVGAVFVESSVSQKFILSLKEGVAARGGDVRLGGELFSDAMGAENTPEGTYIGMVRHNVNTIVSALMPSKN